MAGVEAALNLVWGLVAVALMSVVYRGARRGGLGISIASAMTLGLLICFIVLPVISASDDLLAARQAGLPPAGQTWRMSAEGISAGVDLLPLAAMLLLLICCLMVAQMLCHERGHGGPLTGRETVSQRLRPPPRAV